LNELGRGSTLVSAAEKDLLKEQSLLGQINQDEYRRALVHLYGITAPDQIERGVRILEAEDDDIQFFNGVKETLHMLKSQGFLLGIVTDTRFPVSVKLSWLERGGFGNVWDTIISSNELGMRKPDPKIYQAALGQLGLSADQAVFVGHMALELAGAKSAGMTTIAFNFEKAAQADYYIGDFAELLKLPVIA
jgi:HAD superfamily hydrolase (TIGR01509 family)